MLLSRNSKVQGNDLESNEQFLIRKNTYEWFAIFRVMFMGEKKSLLRGITNTDV